MQFLYNHTNLHDRTRFRDWPEPERRRQLRELTAANAETYEPDPTSPPRLAPGQGAPLCRPNGRVQSQAHTQRLSALRLMQLGIDTVRVPAADLLDPARPTR